MRGHGVGTSAQHWPDACPPTPTCTTYCRRRPDDCMLSGYVLNSKLTGVGVEPLATMTDMQLVYYLLSQVLHWWLLYCWLPDSIKAIYPQAIFETLFIKLNNFKQHIFTQWYTANVFLFVLFQCSWFLWIGLSTNIRTPWNICIIHLYISNIEHQRKLKPLKIKAFTVCSEFCLCGGTLRLS
jgi:hypothetical protein